MTTSPLAATPALIDLEQIARQIRELAEESAHEHLRAIARSQADTLMRRVQQLNARTPKPAGEWR